MHILETRFTQLYIDNSEELMCKFCVCYSNIKHTYESETIRSKDLIIYHFIVVIGVLEITN